MNNVFYRAEPTRTQKLLLWGESLLLTLGFVCMGWVCYSYVESYFFQSYENYTLQEMLKGRQPSLSGYMDSVLSDIGAKEKQPDAATPDVSPRAQERAGATNSRVARPVSGLLG